MTAPVVSRHIGQVWCYTEQPHPGQQDHHNAVAFQAALEFCCHGIELQTTLKILVPSPSISLGL